MLGLRRRDRHGPPPAAWGPAVWRPFPTRGFETLQKGAWGDRYLNQFPAYYNQPQLFTGVEAFNSRYAAPYIRLNELRNQLGANTPGGQRWGNTFTGPVGPLSVAQYSQWVTHAQVQQSGLSAYTWAQALSGG